MNEQESLSFLTASGYFTNCFISGGEFFERSEINGALWRVRQLIPCGYAVYQKMPYTDIWKLRGGVSGITSVIGILSDTDDKWLDRQKKEEKKEKITQRKLAGR